jgi:hypothetical protein
MNNKTDKAVSLSKRAMEILLSRGEAYDNDILESYASTKIMLILYPKGVPAGFINLIRYRYISWIVEKLCRYRRNGDEDNLLDIANYAFLLGAADKEEHD